MKTQLRMDQLPIGERAVVVSLEIMSTQRRRLQDLGLVPGATVRCLLRANSGDPAAFEIRGAVIALRRIDTCRITVQPF